MINFNGRFVSGIRNVSMKESKNWKHCPICGSKLSGNWKGEETKYDPHTGKKSFYGDLIEVKTIFDFILDFFARGYYRYHKYDIDTNTFICE